ncbi:MAG: FliG C-terminal domain-containing protein [Desulfovibrionaceae bacterium]
MRFEDLMGLDEWQTCRMLQDVSCEDVAYAIHGAPPGLRQKLLDRLLGSVRDMILNDERTLPMDAQRVQAARNTLVDAARAILEKERRYLAESQDESASDDAADTLDDLFD